MVAERFVGPELGGGARVILGEGPVVVQNRLLSTDARRCLLRATDLSTGATAKVDLFSVLKSQGFINADEPIPILGCVAPVSDGRLLVAVACGIYFFDPSNGELEPFCHPEAEREHLRPHYNDGKVGPDGCFYVGGMIGGSEGAGRLFRIAPDGSFSQPHVGNPPLTTPNGMHWFPTDDPDVWDFYYVCSQYPAIQRYEHRLSKGAMVRQPDLISLPRSEFGYLDGMTGSTNRLLFLALYLPQEPGVVVIDVETREIVEHIETGAPQTTSAALHGDTLYITSAAQEYAAEDYQTFPDAGSIFKCCLLESPHPKVRAAQGEDPFVFTPL